MSPDKKVKILNAILNHRLGQKQVFEKAIHFSHREIVIWSGNPYMGNGQTSKAYSFNKYMYSTIL